MTHPDLERLTSWVHGLLGSGEAAAVEDHVAKCETCRRTARAVHEEGRLISREIGLPERLAALKAGLLQAAGGRPARSRGLLWQAPVAAAALIGLVAALLSPGERHRLVDGRVALADGRVVAAPTDLPAAQAWDLQALEAARLRLSDLSTVELGRGSRLALSPGGERGVRVDLASGTAQVAVAPDSKRLTVGSPSGRAEAAEGAFALKIVFEEEGGIPMKKSLAGTIVTVFAGSIMLSTPTGAAEARPGQSAVLAPLEAPLFLTAPQDKQEDLLRRLEQLAARVAKLEGEVAQLEAKNQQLKAQLASTAPGQPGGAVWTLNGNPGGVRVIQSPGAAPGGVIIELNEDNEKKPERKAPSKEK